MAFRTFVDGTGQEWQAYTVVPPADERRHADRRGETSSAPSEVSSAAETNSAPDERRESDDRRLTVGRVSRVFGVEPQGWLVFESGTERRRLSPIPSDWSRVSDEELDRYRQSAKPALQTPPGTTAVTERDS